MKPDGFGFLLLCLCVAPLACSETGRDDAAFSGSDCKNGMSGLYGRAQLYVVDQSEPYQGLQCMAWMHDETETLSLDLINFTGACGATYEGVYNRGDSGQIFLAVENPGCEVARCGSCTYDWSFQVEDVAPEAVTVNISEDSCPGDDDPPDEYALHISAEELAAGTGTECVYRETGIFENPDCGALHQPCRLESTDTDFNGAGAGTGFEMNGDYPCLGGEPRCNDGLTCVLTDSMTQPTCVGNCDGDTDCPLEETITCQDGLCLL